MPIGVMLGILIPFVGTAAGAACVFFMRNALSGAVERALSGFAAGVMVAASIWSLLQPAMEEAASMGRLAFLPAFIGFWAGTLFLLLLDRILPHLHTGYGEKPEGLPSALQRTTLMVLAVTLHNIPEGMAVGVVFADFVVEGTSMSLTGALALAIGIAVQNFPEGAIVSAPLRAAGAGKGRAFMGGILSGVAELAAAVLTLLLAERIVPLLPYLLSFAAGAMMFVVVEELVPEMSGGGHSHAGVLAFAAGFTLMMALDVALS